MLKGPQNTRGQQCSQEFTIESRAVPSREPGKLRGSRLSVGDFLMLGFPLRRSHSLQPQTMNYN